MSKDTVMQASGFYPDYVDMECRDAIELGNEGFYRRSLPYRNSASVELCGPLLADLLFNSSGALMPKSDYLIKLFRQPHNFCLMSHESGAGYKLKVHVQYNVMYN
jgi:hypothetical protein